MGIHSEINLFKPSNGSFAPGSAVSGVIKYAVDEETDFKNVIISLKGKGTLVIKNNHSKKGSNVSITTEDYVDIDHYVVQNQEKADKFQIGSYESGFSFTLPADVPASLKYTGSTARFSIRCKIQYYIRIKFVRAGLMSFDKRFKKEINVESGITPRLPVEPVMFGERKTLTQLFSSKKSILNLKAIIQNCVIKPGGKIEFDYEIINDTNVTVKAIETKLKEEYTFTRRIGIPSQVKKAKDVIDSDSKTGSVKSGETKNISVEINVPSDRSSLENSKIVSRDYIVRIIVRLPLPHRDAVLDIPVQVGDAVESVNADGDDQPPSYWEAMGEENNDDDYDVEDEKVDKS